MNHASENLQVDTMGWDAESPASGSDVAVAARRSTVDEAAAAAQEAAAQRADEAIRSSLVTLGFIAFDGGASDNATSQVFVSDELRRHFRRDAYVGVRDTEQQIEFLGRVVEGPFYDPHEISGDSAISRTTLLYPDRTQFRPTYYARGTIEVLGELVDGERLVPTPTRPRPYSAAYIFPHDRLQRMLGLVGEFRLGHLLGDERVPVFADVTNKNFLPRNCGIFGTVGSGKSNTTQVLMEEAVKAGWAVIVIDVEGEYVRMNEPTDDRRLAQILMQTFELRPGGVPDFRVYVPSSGRSEAALPIKFKVPIGQLDPDIIADILQFTEPQRRMFGIATTQALARRRQAAPSREGVFARDAGSRAAVAERSYSLQDLVDGLDETNGERFLLGSVHPQERSTLSTLRSKLKTLGFSGVMDWNATAAVRPLPIHDLLVGRRLSVIDVSETDNQSRAIAIAYVLQALFDKVIETDVDERMPNGERRPRVLVVIEEVHTFISRDSVERMRAVLDRLQIISRRGRKRWMGLALVSQQPGHVPDELFELANTRFIHQLKSTSNLAPVKQTTGGVHEALWGTVPALGPGQCLLTGAIFRNPIFTAIRPAQSRRLLTS